MLEKRPPRICYFCGQQTKARITHINIHRDPPVLYFCSKECREQWVYKRKKKKKRYLVIDSQR